MQLKQTQGYFSLRNHSTSLSEQEAWYMHTSHCVTCILKNVYARLEINTFYCLIRVILGKSGILVFYSKLVYAGEEYGTMTNVWVPLPWIMLSSCTPMIAFASINTVKKGKDSLSILLTSLWCCRVTDRVLGTSRGSWATWRTARWDSDMVPKGLWFLSQIQDKPSTGGSLKLGVYRNTLVSLFKVLISKPTFRVSQGLEFTADSVSDGDLAPSVLYTSVVIFTSQHSCK